jgi:hypothetical protein
LSLILDIGQGAGLSGATGVRPFLPPLLVGALARGDVGVDFDGTDFSFLESELFLLLVLVGAVGSYVGERSVANQTESSSRGPLELGLAGAGVVLGALLFAGSLAAGGAEWWPGVLAGAACALLAFTSLGSLIGRARRRLDASAARLLPVYADALALALAALAIVLPPLGFVAIAGFVLLLVRGGGGDREKYAGLRSLR